AALADPALPSKMCLDCSTLKPHSAFGRHRNTADRRSTYCRGCASARVRRWRVEHPEAQEKIQRRYLMRRKLRSIASD
ncbi:MAG: hypothetical protein JWN14_275, partial [Chthonomonadales bacterium]|nr:hypothetical protein [Chthonomonadales bacterium]